MSWKRSENRCRNDLKRFVFLRPAARPQRKAAAAGRRSTFDPPWPVRIEGKTLTPASMRNGRSKKRADIVKGGDERKIRL
jgi:hypothetical protein